MNLQFAVSVRLLLIWAFLTPPASAAWRRFVATAGTAFVDTPEPHSLEYFTEYPMMRIVGFCPSCTPEKAVAEAKRFTAETDLRLVVTLAGFEVYDLYYHFDDIPGADTKLVLVKTGADQYREIYHREPAQIGAEAVRSRVVEAEGIQLLEARYRIGGHGSEDSCEYFWFGKEGATFVDFNPLLVAAKAVLPPGRSPIWIYEIDPVTPGNNYLWAPGPLVSRIKIGQLGTGERAGIVSVEFKFEYGKVVPSRASYDPSAQ